MRCLELVIHDVRVGAHQGSDTLQPLDWAGLGDTLASTLDDEERAGVYLCLCLYLHVVPGDGDGVVLGHVGGRVPHDVLDDAQGRLRGVDVRVADLYTGKRGCRHGM